MVVIPSRVLGKSAPWALILLMFTSRAARAADADPGEVAYQRALSLYAAGDVAGALARMRESYRISARSELLYNVARLEDEAGDCAASLFSYRQYLEQVPNGQYRDAATQASAELGARCPPAETAVRQAAAPTAATAVAASPTTAPAAASTRESPLAAPADPRAMTPSPSDGGTTRRWLGWSAIGAGGLAAVGAVYFTVSALDKRSQFRSSAEREAVGGPYADWSLEEQQHRHERWAQVLAVAGGALLGGGVVILALGDSKPAAANLTAGVWFEPTGVSAQLSSSF